MGRVTQTRERDHWEIERTGESKRKSSGDYGVKNVSEPDPDMHVNQFRDQFWEPLLNRAEKPT